MKHREWLWIPSALLALAVLWATPEASGAERLPDLTTLSLEELMNLEVTSVSKKSEKLGETAAAVFVITQEDIRRSGATSVPELLQMVPGLNVARIDANKWAITARGFNGHFANKLLVLIDGIPVYTPVFAGVYWDVQVVPMGDVERIEVVRGPGGTMWGANAVNGVINIITKRAQDTQGGLVSVGAGTEERGFGAIRYGGKLGTGAWYRLYGTFIRRDASVDPAGHDAGDDYDMASGGVRVDWQASDADVLTLQANLYDGESAGSVFSLVSLTPPRSAMHTETAHNENANLQGRWQHTISDASDLQLHAYYDHTKRTFPVGSQKVDAWGAECQHRFPLAARQEIVWGLGARLVSDAFTDQLNIAYDPKSRSVAVYSVFAQDEIALVEDRLRLILGSKVEHNDYTGYEIQPNGRLVWTPGKRQAVWAAVSRAVRTPSRFENDVRLDAALIPGGSFGPDPRSVVYTVRGSRDFESESLTAYEIGYRVQPLARLSLDVAIFYNEYDHLRTVELGRPMMDPSRPYIILPGTISNKMKGETYGGELAANWQALEWWRLRLGYSYLQMDLHVADDSNDTTAEGAEGDSPHHQVTLRSSIDLSRNVDFDLAARWVDRLPSQDVSSYLALDIRVGWRPARNWEIAVVGHNLLDTQHPEYDDNRGGTSATLVERSIYGQVTWGF